jgi:hypothetical protein
MLTVSPQNDAERAQDKELFHMDNVGDAGDRKVVEIAAEAERDEQLQHSLTLFQSLVMYRRVT